MNIVVMGPQGSGKTTQAELLAEKYNLPLVDAGTLIRKFAEEDSEEARAVKEKIMNGDLVENEIAAKLVKEDIENQGKNGFVLDGYPRSLDQCKIYFPQVEKVFYLSLADDICVERLLKRGRADDTRESITRRLELYHQLTEPMLTFFREQGILVEVNGDQSIEDIHSEIIENI